MSGAYYNEIEPYAAQWLRNLIAAGHIAPGDVDERDIRDVRPDDLRGYTQCHFFAGIGVWSSALRLAGWPDDRPVWSGSCPCQPFSAAGSRAGFDDERHLWPHWNHLIRERSPGVVFGEQVASKDGLAWLDLVHTDMETAHYAFAAVDLCAAGVGAPHIRQRLWFVADANGSRRASRKQGRAPVGYGAPIESNSSASRLADANGQSTGRHAGSPCSAQIEVDGAHARNDNGSGNACDARDLGDADNARLALGSRSADGERVIRLEGPAFGAAEPVRGFWRGADWIYCRDGKYRPVEPGTFPLAHGATSRVGRLRAYGNAVNREAAATFIAAARETIDA